MPGMTSSRMAAFQWRMSRGWWWSRGVACDLACSTRHGTTWWVADLFELRWKWYYDKSYYACFMYVLFREWLNNHLFLPQPNTFQLVIAYDPSRFQTFVMYHYMDMGWDNEITLRRSMIGYFSYKHGDETSLQLAPSMKSTAFRLNTRISNTGVQIGLLNISD